MSEHEQQLDVLDRGLNQMRELLGGVQASNLDGGTPCADWQVRDLADHVVNGLTRFATMVRGEQVDWAAATPRVESDHASAFAAEADELRAAWRGAGDDVPMGPDMQCAELAVHTWDLATSLGRGTADLDQEVAERGLALMQANLTDENRAPAFGPELPAPEGADAYQRIAAFAGRAV